MTGAANADWLEENAEGLVLRIYVQPRASRNAVAGVHDSRLKLRLAAPPVDGAANKMCLKYLAKLLKRPKSDLEIISGASSRNKRIFCRVPDAAARRAAVNGLLDLAGQGRAEHFSGP
ncbi:MAG: YggU family protein [Desulfococcus sp.]|nr:MAG: YggU family protein [Desulfococcus sp.]